MRYRCLRVCRGDCSFGGYDPGVGRGALPHGLWRRTNNSPERLPVPRETRGSVRRLLEPPAYVPIRR